MPSRVKLSLCAVAVAVVAIALTKIKRAGEFSDPKRGAWKPLEQPDPTVPRLPYGRSYFFFTHHKTGTNLMQGLCNVTAMRSTAGLDQCAFCLRILPPDANDPWGRLRCVPDPSPEHGRLRGQVSRFTLVSSMHLREFDWVSRFAPDFRAVHMIRHPVSTLISAHQYNKFVSTEAGKKWRWDMSAQDIANATSTREELLIEAKAIQKVLVDMSTMHDAVKNDPRVLTLDLEVDFTKANFDRSAERLFRHMLDDPADPRENISTFLKGAEYYDKSRWHVNRTKTDATAAPRLLSNRTPVIEEWNRMEEECHPDAVMVRTFVEAMGYEHRGPAKACADDDSKIAELAAEGVSSCSEAHSLCREHSEVGDAVRRHCKVTCAFPKAGEVPVPAHPMACSNRDDEVAKVGRDYSIPWLSKCADAQAKCKESSMLGDTIRLFCCETCAGNNADPQACFNRDAVVASHLERQGILGVKDCASASRMCTESSPAGDAVRHHCCLACSKRKGNNEKAEES